MKRLLVTGASGFLGSRITDYYRGKYEIYAPSHRELDIAWGGELSCRIMAWSPDFIVHCAAVSDVGRCEREPELSWKINVEGSINIAEAARKAGAKCLICSSDQVYFGSHLRGPHSEEEALSPCNLYGKQKLWAEEECLRVNPECVLLRLSWMYDIRTMNRGEHGDFFRTLLAKINSSEALRFPVHDVRGITDVNEVVRNLERAFGLEGGIYNFGSPNEKNTYGTMTEIFEKLQWDTAPLEPDQAAFLDNPRDMSMSQEKINEKGIFFSRTADALAEHLSQASQSRPQIRGIDSDTDKKTIARTILEALPDWFGIPEATEQYIADSSGKVFLCAYDGEKPVGFLYLKETGRHTVELAVMGVLKEYHRLGIGRKLFEAARERAEGQGYSFIQVKTVQMGRYDSYDDTNRFYLSLGFKELEVFPTLWDECNPCQIYIMSV